MAWILLAYRIPSEPSRPRVALWRRLRSRGAIYLQNGVCLLPKTDSHIRVLKTIANDIKRANGDSVLVEATGFDGEQERLILNRFRAPRTREYRSLCEQCAHFTRSIANDIDTGNLSLATLDAREIRLKKLHRIFDENRKVDFCDADGRLDAVHALQQCERQLNELAQMCFQSNGREASS